MRGKQRVVFIGLDGVPFEMIEEFTKTGIMPNTASLVDHGQFNRIRSTIPEISSVAWPSLITGKNPGEHGIFGFTDVEDHQYFTRFPNYTDLKSTPLWENKDWASVIVNVPSTYPVKAMNGVHISGFVSVDRAKAIYPPSLLSILDQIDYRIDVDSTKAHRSLDLFLSDLDHTLEARIEAYRRLWSKVDWKLFMLVFTVTDRLMHFLWNAYEDSSHAHHRTFLKSFRRIDEAIGEIYQRLQEEDLLILASDHGFERLERDIYVNYILRREGFLKLKDDREGTILPINNSTKAFALDPARIYINRTNRFSQGSVHKKDRERVLRDLDALFGSLEIDNHRVIRRVFRKEEIYSGPCIEQAPDMVLVGNSGFNLKGLINPEGLSGTSLFTGKHALENAFVLYTGLDGASQPIKIQTVAHIRRLIDTALDN